MRLTAHICLRWLYQNLKDDLNRQTKSVHEVSGNPHAQCSTGNVTRHYSKNRSFVLSLQEYKLTSCTVWWVL